MVFWSFIATLKFFPSGVDRGLFYWLALKVRTVDTFVFACSVESFPAARAVSSLKDGSARNLPHRVWCSDSYSHKHFCGEKIYSRQGTRRWENKASIPASGTGQYGSFVLLRNF